MKVSPFRLIVVVLLALQLPIFFMMGVKGLLPDKEVVEIDGYTPWSEDVVAAAGAMPVQESGRIKPLETRASFAMLLLRGDRRMKILNDEGEKITITPVEWMLDVFFRPELAAQMPIFRVDNSEVLKSMDIEIEGRGVRDRYSFQEFGPHLPTIAERAGKLQDLRERGEKLTLVERQTLELGQGLNLYFYLSQYFTFVRDGVVLPSPSGGKDQRVSLSVVMAGFDEIAKVVREMSQSTGTISPQTEELLGQVSSAMEFSKFSFHPLPPNSSASDTWNSVGDLIEGMIVNNLADPVKAVEDIQRLEKVYLSYEKSPEEFAKSLREFNIYSFATLKPKSAKRFKYEVMYNRIKWYKNALNFFILGFLAMLSALFFTKGTVGKVHNVVIWVFTGLGLLCILAAMAHRALIVARPPVTNLFETIPYITAGMLIVFLFIETLTRFRVPLLAAPAIGLVGMVFANIFEISSATDNLDPLQAVLRSNYWLTVHVLTIVLGYSAGLAASVVSFVYIFDRMLGLQSKAAKKRRRTLTRITYGILGFTLVLSLLGTVTGGIWANDSWGRFWGWDPKENGALMIVLWTLFILHARVGGLLREWGIHLATAFSAVVITFSWFHVNMLGTGLHSYGFTDGKQAIWWFYGVVILIVVVGMIDSLTQRSQKNSDQEGASSDRKKEVVKKEEPSDLLIPKPLQPATEEG